VALGASRLGILRQFVGYALRVVCLATAASFLLSLAALIPAARAALAEPAQVLRAE
jgi:ABC-type lipoprotein release transport system permease subunit